MRPHAVWITLLAGGTALILAECGPLAGAPKAAPQALSAPLGAPTLEERKNAASARRLGPRCRWPRASA